MASVVTDQNLVICYCFLTFTGTDNRKVRDIAYDVVSGSLYWTGEMAIYWYSSAMKDRVGHILHKLSDVEFAHGIAVASCRR
jgi:hypothetical protein